jgi:predicted RNase H-like HicB family nuclease
MKTYSVAYPIIFTITNLVPGAGFLAKVRACGKALMVREDDGAWWLYGAEPGGLAASGTTPQEAFLRFSETFKNVLDDQASECTSLNAFSIAAAEFFGESCEETTSEWAAASEAIRSGNLRPEPPFSQMTRQPAETPTFISIEEVPEAALGFSADRHEEAALPTAA